jgi:putative flippase GtrA
VAVQKQFIRFAVIGFASNAIAYAIYIVLTRLGLGPKFAMSLLYGIGVLQTFVFNKRWTFGHRGAHRAAFFRYCMAYGLGYVINLLVLRILVDQQGYPHEIVQGVMILSLAVMLFLLQKYWVFPSNELRTIPK